MALYKIKDFDPNYRDHFEGHDIKDLDLYSNNDKIGSVDDVLVDEEGRFRYLIINTGAWIFGKKVLLPIARVRIDYNSKRAYADGLSKEQVENLPEFNNDLKLDQTYEEQVRGVYRGSAANSSMPLDTSSSVDSPAYLDATPGMSMPQNMGGSAPLNTSASNYDLDAYDYDREPDLYQMNDRDHQNLRLYEERLIANKHRQKMGEVAVGKHVESETARVSVPIEKERVIVERVNPTEASASVVSDATFNEGEVVRMEVFEEIPDIHKEAFVREEVRVKKVVDQDTVNANEEVRREELDLNTNGRPVVDER